MRAFAGADEDAIDLDVLNRRAGIERHVGERPLGGLALRGIGELARVGHDAVRRTTIPGFVPQLTCGASSPTSIATTRS